MSSTAGITSASNLKRFRERKTARISAPFFLRFVHARFVRGAAESPLNHEDFRKSFSGRMQSRKIGAKSRLDRYGACTNLCRQLSCPSRLRGRYSTGPVPRPAAGASRLLGKHRHAHPAFAYGAGRRPVPCACRAFRLCRDANRRDIADTRRDRSGASQYEPPDPSRRHLRSGCASARFLRRERSAGRRVVVCDRAVPARPHRRSQSVREARHRVSRLRAEQRVLREALGPRAR
jgi:hypothetical protein